MPTGSTDSFNLKTYTSNDVVGWYDRLDMLLKPERVIFETHRELIAQQPVLDIGVGGGRTTKYLQPLARDYSGIDYSPQFAELVRKKFRLEQVYHCDARDLSRFAGSHFGFVLFSFNSIDYIDHEGRLQALREIYRVLQPGGIYAFSTHNLSWDKLGKLPWQQERRWSPGLLKDIFFALWLTPRRRRMKKLEVRMPEYAILNDDAHDYTLLTYHITVPAQIRQLEEIGFTDIRAYDFRGNPVNGDDRSNNWIYFTAKKG